MLLNLFRHSQKALHAVGRREFSNISVQLIKQLRELTGSSIGECRKALEAVNGDLEKARDYLKERGLAQAEKKSGRETQEGVVGIKVADSHRFAVLGVVSCETDFVAKSDMFLQFVEKVLQGLALQENHETREITDEKEIDKLLQTSSLTNIVLAGQESKNLYEAKQLTISKLQENIKIKSVNIFTRPDQAGGIIGSYVHNRYSEHIGTSASLIAVASDRPLSGANTEAAQKAANNLAMQILATRPDYLTREKIPRELLQGEIDKIKQSLGKGIEGKPERVIEQIVEGKLQKFYEDNVLLDQQYVLDPTEGTKVADYLKSLEEEVGLLKVLNYIVKTK